ncbi:hypothetical protein LIER_23303 [Lithospermum erythrorhizon]|uniref:non-specific serine/threonine protein kinase n=1 Tax=Lithospermum erythrorhizon TaxID=34254 RepID=A0AAV3QYH1_LITER
MVQKSDLVIIGISVGVAAGILIATLVFFAIRWWKRISHFKGQTSERHLATLPIRTNGLDTSMDFSASLADSKSNQYKWRSPNRKDHFHKPSGMLRYSYKDIQRATNDFTTILGQGSFGPVYKAVMPAGKVVAVKVLASDSKQGEKEFYTEVSLLGRLHHRNLVNLVGYCVDKGQRILIYEFMSNGSLANLLYGEDEEQTLSWDERLQVAHDISHGIEYLHDGAAPPVVHRDLKSANILLDGSMRAKVADFGLSKEEAFDGRKSGLKGTYGYIDPAYIATNQFTLKSDIYSFGIILFELITAIHPHQNLMEYVNLAAMSPDGVDEILDQRLVGTCNPQEVRTLAAIANKCLRNIPKKRPSIAEVSQAISRLKQKRLIKADTMSFSQNDISRTVSQIEIQQVELRNMPSINEKIAV